jgi:hypothetical protein
MDKNIFLEHNDFDQNSDYFSMILDNSIYLFSSATLKDLELILVTVVATLLVQSIFFRPREVIA